MWHTTLGSSGGSMADGDQRCMLQRTRLLLCTRRRMASSSAVPPLRVHDSLQRAKVEFVPARGKRVSWYQCGPTVYADSHLGHARSYVSQDVIRRILRDYFGYDVRFVMNVTDVDDKIILRARQNHLVQQLIERHPSLSQSLIDDVQAAWTAYFEAKMQPLLADHINGTASHSPPWPTLSARVQEDDSYRAACRKRSEAFDMHFDALSASHRALERARGTLTSGHSRTGAVAELVAESDAIVALAQDRLHAASVTDHRIFRQLAQKYETSFFADMDNLNVERPLVLTRVSDYIEEIVAFIRRIIDNGYAYEDGGDVYFDTRAFDGAQSKGKGREDRRFEHFYAKLKPEAKGHAQLLEEGEGALGGKGRKRNPADFALWKASKAGEPSWPSPWGGGRPGWHIECSAMASHVLGSEVDVHAGGADLAFPHHDNEMAQSEAYHDCENWVRYFLHTGHLHINGLKMSKSLKNFTTIEDALKVNTARQLRLLFLMHNWHEGMDYRQSVVEAARTVEDEFERFFRNLSALSAEEASIEQPGPSGFGPRELDVVNQLDAAQENVDAAFRDSFDTPRAVLVLRRLLTSTNTYMAASGAQANLAIVKQIAAWVTRILDTLGLTNGARKDGWVNFGWGGTNATDRDQSTDTLPLARALSAFRDDVRAFASTDAKTNKTLLDRSDRLRDDDLIDLGVQLEDREGQPALVKLVPASVLVAERAERQAMAQKAATAKAAKVSAAQEAADAKAKAKRDLAAMPPEQLFTDDKYGPQRDDQGLPTHDIEGKELSKNARKKVIKDFEKQRDLHDLFMQGKL